MADETFDAVIIGGGTKGLFLAMYLTKYGGMSVGVFERRHEIGGCLATEEIAAPGFRGNTHANVIFPFYHLALWRDFPELWDYGGRIDQYLVASGIASENTGNCLAIYSEKYDPTQERSAKEIAKFSEKDADRWLKLWELLSSEEFLQFQMLQLHLPFEERAIDPRIVEGQMAVFNKMLETGYAPDSLLLQASGYRAVLEWFDNQELQHCMLRWCLSAAQDINETGMGPYTLMVGSLLPHFSMTRGGTHQFAHAAHQILVQNGCKFFTHADVEKVIIENGTAKGIRLSDGSEIKARKLVVAAGMSPHQLCFDLIGREHIDGKLAKRVELLETTFGCLMWYTFALHEAPQYTAAKFNPDINEAYWLALAPNPDPLHISRECFYAKLGQLPPLEDYCPTVWSHSLIDPSYAPRGKHVAQCEQLGPPASFHTEREWFEIKNRYADQLISIWQKHAPNMTWDNVIGVDSNTAYDCCRMKNLRPNGCWAGVDRSPHQMEENRPTPELADHRTPVKNLYATGGSWFPGSNAGSVESYRCYKIIAKDLGLEGKPWEEPGKEEPESLIESRRLLFDRMRASFPRHGTTK